MATRTLNFDDNGVPIHPTSFRLRRFLNWFPLGLGYASLYFMRYNLNVAKSALGDESMTVADFGWIFGVGSFAYFFGFLINGPILDRKGGRWGMLYGLTGAMVANFLMGLVVYGRVVWGWGVPLFSSLLVLYAINMYFQSCGAMAIVTTKMPWFHVRERGTFSTIFGVMISLGIYFAFDWGYALREATRAAVDPETLGFFASIFQAILGTGSAGVDQNWWMFFFPVCFAAVWLLIMIVYLRNTPGAAGHEDFETGDQNVSDRILTMKEMAQEIFFNPRHRVLRIIVFIEFCSGAIRNGSFQFYPMFAKKVGFYDDFWITQNWGLCLLICGFIGANMTGWVSDKFFGSKRGPMAMFLYAAMVVAMLMITFSLGDNTAAAGSAITGLGLLIVATSIIGVHGILSGTAAGDFSGIKNTGKAVGIVDGAVYLGTGIQSILTGLFIPKGEAASDPSTWIAWPLIILPCVIVGTILSLKIYHAFPEPKGKAKAGAEEDIEPAGGGST